MDNKNFKILIADDDPDIARLVEKELKAEGYATVTAFDGEQALSRVKSDDPDLIILDLMMPKLNGFEVLKEIREKFTDKWRPVMIVSGNSDLDTVRKCYDLEADHYLNKPCTAENLIRGVKTMISLIPMRIK